MVWGIEGDITYLYFCPPKLKKNVLHKSNYEETVKSKIEGHSAKWFAWILKKCQCHERKIKAGELFYIKGD